tara:strand:+ start:111 stop:479 length:369 start_codon:yes stop_codon:yes gene_type:complete
MIYPIRVWRRKGLRRLLRHDLAKSMNAAEVFDEQQKHYELSNNERNKFNRMNLDDWSEPVTSRSLKPVEATFKVTCIYCGKEAMRTQARAKYCSDECYRTYYSHKRYSNQKGDQDEAECREI